MQLYPCRCVCFSAVLLIGDLEYDFIVWIHNMGLLFLKWPSKLCVDFDRINSNRFVCMCSYPLHRTFLTATRACHTQYQQHNFLCTFLILHSNFCSILSPARHSYHRLTLQLFENARKRKSITICRKSANTLITQNVYWMHCISSILTYDYIRISREGTQFYVKNSWSKRIDCIVPIKGFRYLRTMEVT